MPKVQTTLVKEMPRHEWVKVLVYMDISAQGSSKFMSKVESDVCFFFTKLGHLAL